MAIKVCKFVLRTSRDQATTLKKWSGALRWIWNHAIERQQALREKGAKHPSYVDMAKWLTEWRGKNETKWLSEGPVHPQQHTLKRLAKAYEAFFKKRGGFPNFKCRGFDPSIHYPDAKQFKVDEENARVLLPKLGWVRYRKSQMVGGVVKNITVQEDVDQWTVSMLVEIPDRDIGGVDITPTIAICVVDDSLVTSEATVLAPPKSLAVTKKRMDRYRRMMERKRHKSSNRAKARNKLLRAHRQYDNQRRDWINKLTTEMVKSHKGVAMIDPKPLRKVSHPTPRELVEEDINTAEAPRVTGSVNLDKRPVALGMIKRQLEYKLAWVGGQLMVMERIEAQAATVQNAIGEAKELLSLAVQRFEGTPIAMYESAAGCAVGTELMSDACKEMPEKRRSVSDAKKAAGASKQEPRQSKQ